METSIRYKKLQEKFNLPQLNELKATFNIDIEENDKIFDNIRNEISEKLFSFAERVIEPMISGNIDSLCSLYEIGMISNTERERLFVLYKNIQSLKWENNMLMVKADDKRTAEWINRTWDFWNNELGLEVEMLCKKLSIGWKNLSFKEEKVDYHG